MKQEIKTVNHSELEENMNTTSESNDLIEENTNNFSDTSTKILSEEETKNTLPTDIIQKMGGTEGDRKEAIELYQKYSWNKEQLDNGLKEIVGTNVSNFMEKIEKNNLSNGSIRRNIWGYVTPQE